MSAFSDKDAVPNPRKWYFAETLGAQWMEAIHCAPTLFWFYLTSAQSVSGFQPSAVTTKAR